jgi:hypothetical protein
MNARFEPRNLPDEPAAEFEAADSGWDPYVASLLTPGQDAGAVESSMDEDDGPPVMSFNRRPAVDAR